MIENATHVSGPERKSEFTYTKLDQIDTITVTNVKPSEAGGGTETLLTRYLYGYGANGDLLRQIEYPTSGPVSQSSETFGYNSLGELTSKLERTGVHHTYHRDALGQIIEDNVTESGTLPASIDDAITEITYQYDAMGNLIDARGTGRATTEVERHYNGLGQLEWEGQYHGLVGGATTYLHEAGTGRLRGMIYPNGRTLTYQATGLDAALNRPTSIQDSTGTLEAYTYLGLGQIVGRDRPAPGQPDQWVTLDSKGRVEWLAWQNGADGKPVEYTYGYTNTGQLQWKRNQQKAEFGERFDCNALGYLSLWQRGVVDSTGHIPGSAVADSFELDSQGTRYGGKYDTPMSYDAGGNQQSVGLGTSSSTLKFDAWGRVVEATGETSSGDFKYRYAYDALGRMIGRKQYAIDAGTTVAVPQAAVDYFHDGSHVIEERVSGVAKVQYVWSPDGQVILQDRDTDGSASTGPGGLEERRYALTDEAGSVVAITNDSGHIVERYVYDNNGSVEGLDADWEPLGGSVSIASRAGWVYFWHGNRAAELVRFSADTLSTHDASILPGGGWYDPFYGKTIQPDPMILASGRNAYNGGRLEWYHRLNLVGAPVLAAIGGFAVGGPAGAYIAGSSVAGFVGGYSRYHDGQSLSQSVWGGVWDGTGVSAVYGGFTNTDIITGKSLGWSTAERWIYGSLGAIQLLDGAMIGGYGVYRAAMSPTVRSSLSLAYRSTLYYGGQAIDAAFGMLEQFDSAFSNLFTMGVVGSRYGALGQYQRLPVNLGRWTGLPGRSGWLSDLRSVRQIVGNEPIPYRLNPATGRYHPDLSAWATAQVDLPAFAGYTADFRMADELLAARWSTPERSWTREMVSAFRDARELTWHHVENGTTAYLVPRALNNIPHIGGVAIMGV